jgi:hypothetical protein
MTIILRQATAGQEVPLGPFLDSTDGDSEEAGLTINAADILIWKTGATTLPAKNSGGATHISDGIYYATLDASDTNTVGSMKIFVHVAGALFCTLTCLVLPTAVYDSLIAGSDSLTVDLNADQSAATVGTVSTVTSVSALASTAVDDILDAAVNTHTTANTVGENINIINDMLTGKMTNVGTTITHYKQDGTSVRKQFTKDNATSPSSRTPV